MSMRKNLGCKTKYSVCCDLPVRSCKEKKLKTLDLARNKVFEMSEIDQLLREWDELSNEYKSLEVIIE